MGSISWTLQIKGKMSIQSSVGMGHGWTREELGHGDEYGQNTIHKILKNIIKFLLSWQ